jgi:hypothetical protein
MQRLRAAAFPLALVVALGIGVAFFVGDSAAELDPPSGGAGRNQVFTSRPDRISLVVPRGWRATDLPSYPGLLLWMMRSQPPGQIVLTAESFTRDLYCSWPIPCRTSHDSLPQKFACALRVKLQDQHMRVGPVQPGPKDNEASGVPSVWFEYDDGKQFLRQAVALSSDRAISLVLAAPTNEARAAHVRPFEQALRSLHALTAAESAPVGSVDAAVPTIDAAPADATTLPIDAQALDAGAMFESAPAPKINPVGPCP